MTEDWAAVFEALKEFVADSLRSVAASEGGARRRTQDGSEDEDDEDGDEEDARARAVEERRQKRLKSKAEVAVHVPPTPLGAHHKPWLPFVLTLPLHTKPPQVAFVL